MRAHKRCEFFVGRGNAGAEIAVRERHGNRNSFRRQGQRLGNITQEHVCVIGDAIRMGRDTPVENEYFTVGQQFAQMIVGPPVTKSEFQHRAGNLTYHAGREIEAFALRGYPPNKGIKTTHVRTVLCLSV